MRASARPARRGPSGEKEKYKRAALGRRPSRSPPGRGASGPRGCWRLGDPRPRRGPASLLQSTELYLSEVVRHRILPHVDLMNRGIGTGNVEDPRLRLAWV